MHSVPRRVDFSWSAQVGANHIEERTKTEEKAKVVASVRSEEFIQFLVALAVLPIGRFVRIG